MTPCLCRVGPAVQTVQMMPNAPEARYSASRIILAPDLHLTLTLELPYRQFGSK
jgi:hypothetical protein